MKIVFVFRETKEKLSLEAVIQAIKPLNFEVKLTDVKNKVNGDVYVYSHPAALEVYGKRPALGVEHGISPFKKYTYSKLFCNYDWFLAPTPIWQKRLKDLYNFDSYLGGYPKLDTYKRIKKGKKTLVVFSWGVLQDKVKTLPKSDNIIYSHHPTAKKKYGLDKDIGRVVGDHSSLTLECAFLGYKPRLFLIPEFYKNDVNLPPNFYSDFRSEQIQLDPNRVMTNKETLIDFIKGNDSFPDYEFHPDFFPPINSMEATFNCFKNIFN